MLPVKARTYTESFNSTYIINFASGTQIFSFTIQTYQSIINRPSGRLTLTNSRVKPKFESVGEGVSNQGTLTITNSSLVNLPSYAISNSGSLVLTNVAVVGTKGLGKIPRPAINNTYYAQLTNVTISQNAITAIRNDSRLYRK